MHISFVLLFPANAEADVGLGLRWELERSFDCQFKSVKNICRKIIKTWSFFKLQSIMSGMFLRHSVVPRCTRYTRYCLLYLLHHSHRRNLSVAHH